MAWKRFVTPKALTRDYYVWQLDRPARPGLPRSYFWTWDHSTNWVLDEPGTQTSGCATPYLKRPESFEEDYRRLTDLAAGLGIQGIVIWGFLRDAHGGVKAAKRVAAYARRQGVGIYPGIGVTAYNGIYYEGRNRFCLLDFLKRHPECRALNADGTPREGTGCVAHPRFQKWFAEGIRWLFEEVGVEGFNLENGDFFVDHNPAMKALRDRMRWPVEDSETFFNQAMSYKLALESVPVNLRKVFASYATYSGFMPSEKPGLNGGMGPRPPAMLDVLPKESICQWTLTGMLRGNPLPLTAYWDNGAPAAAFENPNWPVNLRPPGKRAVGFIHQGSQWWGASRYKMVVSAIKEGCLRAYRAGMEGVSIHGEVNWRHFPYAMNYLAFSHFTHWPEDSMRDFGRKTLGQVLGSAKDGEDFALVLSHLDAGTMTPEIAALAHPERHGFPGPQWGKRADSTDAWQSCRLWIQLKGLADWAIHKTVVESTPDMPEPWNT